jgi:NAD(P)-dependent dehydrogenase (short-subunit alcohol dehydrogenase family)
VVDVRDFDAVQGLSNWVHDNHGDVRLLANNAGIETLGFMWELTAAQWHGSVDVLVNAVFYGVRAFAPRMKEATQRGKRAAIVNTASIGGLVHGPMQTAYIMAKHACISLSECLSLEMELTKTPIDVSVITPGLMNTRIFQDAVVAHGSNAAWAERHRTKMAAMMETAGKVPEDVGAFLFEQLAARQFWISTQPNDTAGAMAARAAYLRNRERPHMNDHIRELF